MTENDVKKLIAHLRDARDAHLSLGREMLTADGGNLFPLDLLANAVLNRSLALIEGFCCLIEQKNFISAAPLLRLQIDNILRFSAAWLVLDPHGFAHEVLKGTPVRKQKARDGQLMTDAYLLKQLAGEAPWIPNVYEQTSGYIHLSEKHIFSASQAATAEDHDLVLTLGYKDKFPPELYVEALLALKEATHLVLKYAHGWAATKARRPLQSGEPKPKPPEEIQPAPRKPKRRRRKRK